MITRLTIYRIFSNTCKNRGGGFYWRKYGISLIYKAMLNWFNGLHWITLLFILSFFLFHSYRFQNFLRIENRTIISQDMASFVQEGQVLHNCYKNKQSKYVCLAHFWTDLPTGNNGNRKECLFLWFFYLFFFFTNQPTNQKGSRKIRHESTEHGLIEF